MLPAMAQGVPLNFSLKRVDFLRAAARAACALIAAASLSACAAEPPVQAPIYTAVVNPSLQSLVDKVLDDAARRTGVAVEKLQVLSADSVTWPDGSLGCPQPGMMYTQALVPGYRVRIQAAGQLLDYHASSRGALVVCPAGRATEPIRGEAT